jgi:hypothetical protein
MQLTVELVRGALGLKTKMALITVAGEAKGRVAGNESFYFQNTSIHLVADLPLPKDGSPLTLEDITKYLASVPELLETINNGLGVPLSYVLTPISKFHDIFGMETEQQVFLEQVSSVVVHGFMRTFQTITDHATRISQLEKIFDQEFVPESYRDVLGSSIIDMDNFNQRFQEEVRAYMVSARSGVKMNQTSLPSQIEIINEMKKITFPALQQKTFFYNTLKANDVEYVGKSSLSEMWIKKRSFFALLIPKGDLSKSSGFVTKYFYFMDHINSTKLAIDCEFDHEACSAYEVSEGRIVQYSDAKIVDSNVEKKKGKGLFEFFFAVIRKYC